LKARLVLTLETYKVMKNWFQRFCFFQILYLYHYAWVEKGNLRELALARMGDLGLRCRDVRTRWGCTSSMQSTHSWKESTWSQPLNLKCDFLASQKFYFTFNLYRYNPVGLCTLNQVDP
jgi:histone acetyltransferase (RNA polymerase elongator complex component)